MAPPQYLKLKNDLFAWEIPSEIFFDWLASRLISDISEYFDWLKVIPPHKIINFNQICLKSLDYDKNEL